MRRRAQISKPVAEARPGDKVDTVSTVRGFLRFGKGYLNRAEKPASQDSQDFEGENTEVQLFGRM
jgi:hypothetical protein